MRPKQQVCTAWNFFEKSSSGYENQSRFQENANRTNSLAWRKYSKASTESHQPNRLPIPIQLKYSTLTLQLRSLFANVRYISHRAEKSNVSRCSPGLLSVHLRPLPLLPVAASSQPAPNYLVLTTTLRAREATSRSTL